MMSFLLCVDPWIAEDPMLQVISFMNSNKK